MIQTVLIVHPRGLELIPCNRCSPDGCDRHGGSVDYVLYWDRLVTHDQVVEVSVSGRIGQRVLTCEALVRDPDLLTVTTSDLLARLRGQP